MDFPNVTFDEKLEGLYKIDEFISEEEEKKIMACLEEEEWANLANWRVLHFGFEFKYGSNDVNSQEKIRPFPEYILDILNWFEPILSSFRIDE